MIDSSYVISVIMVMGAVTFLLRALPFVAAKWLGKHPIVDRLGKFLPLAIMTLLLVNAMTSAAKQHAHGPWPELLAIAVVFVLQWHSKNALLSLLIGTALYVFMRNTSVF